MNPEHYDVEVKLVGRSTGDIMVFNMVAKSVSVETFYEEEEELDFRRDPRHTALSMPKLETLRFDISPLVQKDGTQYTLYIPKENQ